MSGCAALLLAAVVAFLPAWARAQAVQGGPLPGPLPLFPASNWWNVDVTSAPVDPNSAAIHLLDRRHEGACIPDFGGDSSPSPSLYGMPYAVVPGTQPLEPVAFDYASESDVGAPGRPAGYPIPVEAKTQPRWIEGGYPGNCDSSYAGSPCRGDKHLLVVDKDHRLLFETWNTRCLPAGSATCSWRAGSGAVFPLDSNARRPERLDERGRGGPRDPAGARALRRGLRRPVADPPRVPLHAARLERLRVSRLARRGLEPERPAPRHAPQAQAGDRHLEVPRERIQKIFQAMKTYGLIVADNGTDMYVQGTYDTRWDNGVLNPAFSSIHASDFEVVQLGWKPSASTT